MLKQAASAGPKPTEPSSECNTDSQRQSKNAKCCDTCKVKPTSKRTYDQIRCSFCTHWYHETCVGITEDEPAGIWLCKTCRDIPTSMKQNINIMKSEINDLKVCTQSILKAVQDLSKKFENSIEGVNDRITSLTRRVNEKDLCITESIEQLQDTTKTLKTSLDQKTSQILNKTTAVLDKVKTKTENPTKVSGESKISTDVNKNINTNNGTVNAPKQKQLKKPQQKPKQQQPTNNSRAKSKSQGSTVTKQVNHQTPQYRQNTNDETDPIDLTESPKKIIKQSTLLIGSSILKHVKTNELNSETTVRSFPGATTTTLKNKLTKYNIDECKTIILHVGGNDGDNGDDLEDFCDNYTDLLESLVSDDRRLIVSGLLPRETCNLEPYNDQLKSLCAENDIEYIDHYDSFLLATGEIPSSYYWKDKVHLNQHGKRKLLSSINEVCKITSDQNQRYPRRLFQGSRQGVRPPYHRGSRPLSKFCHICRTNNHSTQVCWYNGRNSGMPGRSAQ